ncbi:hypothetical protein HYPSUDRAFT_909671 [Hypholoma sublateritium FD-334 SS-4]|uniref:Uncharacterized protein n=1 Tax=Hypholoma sublateritium (strain FD-334 SS-4) TaxID=945553 RepID=A0A0D2M758_HYPSF|nr:hypothetical protein HYPSUDRAFT_909671 [Hypholoma sublateritium FD-334 SS-4]
MKQLVGSSKTSASSLYALLERYMRLSSTFGGRGLRNAAAIAPRLLVALLQRATLGPPMIPSRSMSRTRDTKLDCKAANFRLPHRDQYQTECPQRTRADAALPTPLRWSPWERYPTYLRARFCAIYTR